MDVTIQVNIKENYFDMKRHGLILKFTKDGVEHKAIAYQDEQHAEFGARYYIRHINNDHTFKLDEDGKKICGLKAMNECTIIGYVD